MMIIQFFVSEPELKAFFEGCGFQVVTKQEPRWRQSVHNQMDFYEVDVMCVQVSESQTIKADELYQQTVKAQLMRTDLSAKLAIKSAISTINKKK